MPPAESGRTCRPTRMSTWKRTRIRKARPTLGGTSVLLVRWDVYTVYTQWASRCGLRGVGGDVVRRPPHRRQLRPGSGQPLRRPRAVRGRGVPLEIVKQGEAAREHVRALRIGGP